MFLRPKGRSVWEKNTSLHLSKLAKNIIACFLLTFDPDVGNNLLPLSIIVSHFLALYSIALCTFRYFFFPYLHWCCQVMSGRCPTEVLEQKLVFYLGFPGHAFVCFTRLYFVPWRCTQQATKACVKMCMCTILVLMRYRPPGERQACWWIWCERDYQ